MAHYQHWNTKSHQNGGNEDWLVMCGSDGRKVYLGSNPDKNVATDNGRSFDKKYRLYVNNGDSINIGLVEKKMGTTTLS